LIHSNNSLVSSMNPASDPRQMRRIIAEDPEWNLATVPLLTELCVNNIIFNFANNPILDSLLPAHKTKVLNKISVDLPLAITAPLIDYPDYWKRCCTSRWRVCDVSLYGGCWKRMFFERNLEELIEKFVPGTTDPSILNLVLSLSANFIQSLNIKQLLPPVKESPNKDEDDLSDSGSESGDAPAVDHFDMNVVVQALPRLEELHITYGVVDCGMNFEWNLFDFTSRDCSFLAKAVKVCHSLKMLHLHKSKVDDEKARVLISHMMDHPCLEILDLSYNKIGNSGARAIGKLLNGHCKLITLDLTDNRIEAQGAAAIGHAIGKNNTLKKMSLRLNRLADDGCQSICRALISKNACIEEINLGSNDFGVASAAFIAQVLVYNKSLTSFNLSCNKITEEGGKTIQEGMEDNNTITSMDLRLTDIGQECEYCISQMLKKNKEAKRKPIT